MLVSIIIPVLNEAERLPHLLQYLYENGGNQICEIIVVDGNSSDDSANIARAAGAMVIQTSPSRAGQMNAGARMAKSEILYFIHADTTPPPNFITHIFSTLQQHWDMGCFRYRFDNQNLMLRINSWFTRFPFLFCQGGDKTFFITADLFRKMEGYDEKYVVMEEYDFLRRARKAKLKMRIVPETAIVSARKYENKSWIKVQIANLVAFNLWQWRLAEPKTIKHVYKRLLS